MIGGHRHGSPDEATLCPFEPAALPDECAGLVRQVRDPEHRTEGQRLIEPVLTYRADLVLTPADHSRYLAPPILAIECDGHDFHDRTKQQAAYDRARDRELLLRGITTIRFTGSEIHHSAERCAASVIDVYRALLQRAARARAPESYITAWGG